MARLTSKTPLLLISLLLTAALAHAQDPPPGQSPEVIRISTELVVTDVLVQHKETGRIIGGLKSADFLLYEDGVKQQITHFSQDKLPLSILLLLDVSGSVRGVIHQIQAGAEQALRHLKPEDEVAVMAFGTRPELLQDFTTDRRLIAEQIARADDEDILRRAGRATSLNEAVYQAATHISRAANPISRRVIIGVTDNISNQPFFVGHSEGEAFEQLFESGSVVCGLLVRDAMGKIASVTNKHPINILTRKVMAFGSISTYANKTGGEVMKAEQDEVNLALAKVIDHLRTRYSLGYESSNPKRDGKFRKIKLRLAPEVEKREGKLVMRTKQGYYARPRDQANDQEKTPRR
jgi:VWFA-related protein